MSKKTKAGVLDMAFALHDIQCQSCGYEAWSTTGHPVQCRECGGIMVEKERMDEKRNRH